MSLNPRRLFRKSWVSALDVRLLVVFDARMSERHVTRAVTKLRLSQPAISTALRRLREIFDDELFRRTADGMMPTPRAVELGIPLAQVLRQLENAMQPPTFVPEQAERTFRLAVSPPVTAVLVPGLVERVLAQAPGIDLRIQSTPGLCLHRRARQGRRRGDRAGGHRPAHAW